MFENIKERLRHQIVVALGGRMPPKPEAALDLGYDVEFWDLPADRKAANYTNEIHHIERGHVRALHFRDNLALPEHTGQLWFHSGTVNEAETPWKIDTTLRVIARCAPWVRVYAGSRIGRLSKTDDITTPAGVAVMSTDGDLPSVILMRLDLNRRAYLSTLHHEIWHAIENDAINKATIARITQACRLGAEFDGDAYLASDVERRARAYQAYAILRDEMPQMRVLGTTLRPGEDLSLTEIFEAVYSGQFARDLGVDYRGAWDAAPGKAAAAVLASQGRSENPCIDSRDAVLQVFSLLGDMDFESDDFDIHAEFLGHLIDHDHAVRMARED